MIKTNIKIIFLLVILLAVFIFASTAQAVGDSLYISPATSTINVGYNITTSVLAGTSGDKICAVQGTIVFNNLTCQSITLANGMMAQTQPTCSNPSFVIGIPNCVTTNTSLFTVSSKAGNVGVASISFSGVNLVGFGASVGTASTGGNYTINALPVAIANKPVEQTTKTVATTKKTTTQVPVKTTSESNSLQASLAGAKGADTFFGWVWSNIIWIIVLIIASATSYVAGRMSCKKNKK